MGDLVTDVDAVVAVDIGGTKIAAAVLDRSGRVLDGGTTPTPARDGAESVLDAVAALVVGVVGRCPGHRILALGVGSAGIVDPVSGRVLGATDAIAGWAGTDLRAGLAARTALPVAVLNDVHAHALGEATSGEVAELATVLFVAVGTGVGGAVVLRDLAGGLLTGGRAAAGHVGHVPSRHAGDLPCSCGAVGHLEAIASGPALVREYARRTSVHLAGLEDVVARAAEGDQDAGDVLVLGGVAVGAAIGGLVNVLDPDAVVVGGGVVGVGETWWHALTETVGAETLPSLRDVTLVRSSLGGRAALLGAASRAWDLCGEDV